MDPLTVVGLVSAIVQFVDFGIKVVERLNEYKHGADKVPEVFRNIGIQLPLVINTLKQTQRQADTGQVSEETARDLKPVVDACLADAKELEDILAKALPSGTDSALDRGFKAFGSLAIGKTVEKIEKNLTNRVVFLTYHQSTIGPTSQVQVLQLANGNPENRRKPCFMVKFPREDNFVGREDVIKEIDKRFAEQQHRVAIAGIGGIGKSQIAVEYCYRYKQIYPKTSIFWVYASSHDRFVGAYQEIARELALPGFDDPAVDTLQLVLDWLSDERNGPWLLILDNVDDIETVYNANRHTAFALQREPSMLLSSYLPQASIGRMIITTRDKRVGEMLASKREPIYVEAFGMEDAKLLLQRTLRNDNLNEDQSKALIEALDSLPMAITQAAAFIRENSIALADYLVSLQANDQDAKDLLAESYYDPGRDAESLNSVFQTWQISFDSIRRQKPRAAEILSLMAVLDRHAVKDKLLHKQDERKVDFVTAIGTLKAFSLITEQKEGHTYGMHRLVQLLTQRWLELEGETQRWQEKALTVIYECFDKEDGRYYKWTEWEAFNPHIQVVIDFPLTSTKCLLKRANLLHSAAIYDLEHGHFVAAEIKSRESVAIYETHLDEGHKSRRTSTYILALALQSQGKYEAAELLHRQGLATAEKFVGPDDVDSITSLLSLADISKRQGKWRDFEEMSRQALGRCERVLDSENRLTLGALSNVADVLKAEGKWEAAKEMLQRVVEAHKATFGAEHPITLASSGRVANLLKGVGKYEEAESIMQTVFEGLKKMLGINHPDTLHSLLELSVVLGLQGRFGVARSMNQQALDGLETVLALDHPITLDCACSLANLLAKENKYGEAEPLYRRALDGYMKNLDTSHSHTLRTAQDLAMALEAQGKYKNAEDVVQKILALSEEKLGTIWVNTRACMQQHIGKLLGLQGKHDAAEEILLRALADFEESVAQNDLATLSTVVQLAFELEQQNKNQPAEEMLRRALYSYEESLGPEHLHTVNTARNLAWVLRKQGKYDATEPVARRALSDCERVLGTTHRDTVQSTEFLGEVLCRLGRDSEAIVLYRKAYLGFEKLFGAKNPSGINCMRQIALLEGKKPRQTALDAQKPGKMSKIIKIVPNLRKRSQLPT